MQDVDTHSIPTDEFNNSSPLLTFMYMFVISWMHLLMQWPLLAQTLSRVQAYSIFQFISQLMFKST